MTDTIPSTIGRRVLLAAPRGCCAGVDRAVETVETALEKYGPPVFVRKQIVHNTHVVAKLAQQGAVFVEELAEVPEGGIVVFSAHGIAPTVRTEAADRGLATIDATCPLVSKVHMEARRFAREGYDILLVGHAGHEEVIGTLGHAPGRVHLVTGPDDIADVRVRDEERVVWLSQTTLSVDEAQTTVAALKERFPALVSPPSDDICYASQNRQTAVKRIAGQADVVLVVGSPNSSNSVRLVEVARDAGAPAAHLVDSADDLDETWLAEAATVGLTSGASVPDVLVKEVLHWLAARGYDQVEVLRAAAENTRFALPRELRRVPRGPTGPRAAVLPELADIRAASDELIVHLLERETPRLNTLGPAEHRDALRTHLLRADSERTRAFACFWGWRGAGGTGPRREVHRAAAALELHHSAVLIHHGVLDRSEPRGSQPALHHRFATHHAAQAWHGDSTAFGDAVALPTGDLCLAWAGELIGGCGEGKRLRTVVNLYHRMCAEAAYGQTLALRIAADRDYQVDRCREVVIHGAARYLFTPPLLIGAALAGADERVHIAYEEFGTALGEAQRLRNELLGVFGAPDLTGEPPVDDLRDGRPTMLFATALRAASPTQRGRLLELYGRHDLAEDTADELRTLLRRTRAVATVEEMIRARGRDAARALRTASIADEPRAALEALAAHALSHVP